MARYVSFRFDDGFIQAANVAAACLKPDHGTFFIVADLVSNGSASHPEPLFSGRSFGSLAEWRKLSQAGQDVQLHGRSHRNLQLLSAAEQCEEVSASLAFTRQIHQGPYVFCHPFNRLIELNYAAMGIAAAGFQTRTSDNDLLFHRLTEVDPFKLCSWAVRERHFDKVVDQLAGLPDNSWTILAFHSFGQEGHEPWSVPSFRNLVAACRNMELAIASISAIVKLITEDLCTPTT